MWLLLAHFTDEETKAQEVYLTWQKVKKLLEDEDEICNVRAVWLP